MILVFRLASCEVQPYSSGEVFPEIRISHYGNVAIMASLGVYTPSDFPHQMVTFRCPVNDLIK